MLPASPSPTVHKNKEVNENPNLNPKYRRLFRAAVPNDVNEISVALKKSVLKSHSPNQIFICRDGMQKSSVH